MDQFCDSLAAIQACTTIRLIRFRQGIAFPAHSAPCQHVTTLLSLTNQPTGTATEVSYAH